MTCTASQPRRAVNSAIASFGVSVPACAEVLRSRGLAEKVHILSHDCGPEIQELLKSGEVDFTIGQDLAYQPYQALSVLFEALMGQRPDRDTYVTACPILNSESI